jgi:hypothetical protein
MVIHININSNYEVFIAIVHKILNLGTSAAMFDLADPDTRPGDDILVSINPTECSTKRIINM